jgi:hypothetical protein
MSKLVKLLELYNDLFNKMTNQLFARKEDSTVPDSEKFIFDRYGNVSLNPNNPEVQKNFEENIKKFASVKITD